MQLVLDPFRFVLISIAGWMNQHQLQVIDYLREENRVLREQLGGRRLRLNDDQRRRLAAKAILSEPHLSPARLRHEQAVRSTASAAIPCFTRVRMSPLVRRSSAATPWSNYFASGHQILYLPVVGHVAE